MNVPATMRAQVQTSLHGPQDMQLVADAPTPRPGDAVDKLPHIGFTHRDAGSHRDAGRCDTGLHDGPRRR